MGLAEGFRQPVRDIRIRKLQCSSTCNEMIAQTLQSSLQNVVYRTLLEGLPLYLFGGPASPLGGGVPFYSFLTLETSSHACPLETVPY